MTSIAYAVAEIIARIVAAVYGVELGPATSGTTGWPV